MNSWFSFDDMMYTVDRPYCPATNAAGSKFGSSVLAIACGFWYTCRARDAVERMLAISRSLVDITLLSTGAAVLSACRCFCKSRMISSPSLTLRPGCTGSSFVLASSRTAFRASRIGFR